LAGDWSWPPASCYCSDHRQFRQALSLGDSGCFCTSWNGRFFCILLKINFLCCSVLLKLFHIFISGITQVLEAERAL
jgi:hypothetical protein